MIHASLSQASTLPKSAYLDPAALAAEKKKLFSRVWWPVAREENLPEVGSYLTVEVAGEPVIVARGEARELRAFSRVCRHRAGSVGVEGGGCSKRLQCRYHGWAYDLSGKLLAAPEFEGVENFRRESTALPSFRVESWGGFVFVNLDSSGPSLTDWLGEMVTETKEAGYDLGRYRQVVRKDYVLQCNWKVYVDNYLEGYHIPIAHPALFQELDYKQYAVHPRRYHSFQNAPIRPVSGGKKRAYGKEGQANRTLYYWLFPHFMLNIYPDNMSANYVIPLSHDRTLTIFEWYLPADKKGQAPRLTASAQKKLAAFSHQVQLEDIEICESVQRNLGSSTYDRGRYSVKRENGVHHFHRLVEEFAGELGG